MISDDLDFFRDQLRSARGARTCTSYPQRPIVGVLVAHPSPAWSGQEPRTGRHLHARRRPWDALGFPRGPLALVPTDLIIAAVACAQRPPCALRAAFGASGARRPCWPTLRCHSPRPSLVCAVTCRADQLCVTVSKAKGRRGGRGRAAAAHPLMTAAGGGGGGDIARGSSGHQRRNLPARECERHTLQSPHAHPVRAGARIFEGESAPLHVACGRWSTARRQARS